MTAEPTSPTQEPSAAGRLAAAAWAGVKIALIVSTVVGLLEVAGSVYLNARHMEAGLRLGALDMAAAGKACITQFIVWCPVALIVAAGYWAAFGRRRLTAAEPILAAVLVLLAGLVVAPVDLHLAGRAQTSILILTGVIVVAAALVAYVLLRYVFRRYGVRRARRAVTITATGALAVVVVCGLFFIRSPLSSPASYRAPTGANLPSRAGRPNVLMIVLDTVRADRMSCHGFNEATTPFLDSWAGQALVFDRAVSNATWTVPSHASMFTGRSIREHGMDFFHLRLGKANTTIAEVLAAAGYRTVSFSNNAWISRDTGLARGFQQCHIMHFVRRLGRASFDYLVERAGITPPLPWLDADTGAGLTNTLVAGWLDDNAGQQPVFVFVNYMDAHLPYRVPAEYRRMFMTEDQVRRSYALRWGPYGNIVPALAERYNTEGGDFLAPADVTVLRRLYLASIRYLDDRVGELIRLFEDRGLLDNTLVVIASDHGEYLGTHGMWDHRFLTYDDVTHVSLLIRDPGRKQGARLDAPVQLADIYPTILDAALNEPPTAPGVGARDLLDDAPRSDVERVAITEYNGPTPTHIGTGRLAGAPAGGHRDQPQVAATGARYKLMVSADGTRELYDLRDDPTESRNLIDELPDVASDLARHIDEWHAQTKPYVPPSDELVPAMDPELKKMLEALGYVADETSISAGTSTE